ncbi:MAG TPA: hypothetical protein VF486_24795 [Actinomycetes bacterium]
MRRSSRLGCLGLGIFLLAIGALAVVPDLVMEAPASRLPAWVLRWRNGGGVEIASGTIAGKPWWVHGAKRAPAGVGRRLLCVYFLHDSISDRRKSIDNRYENPGPHRLTEAMSCGFTPTADHTGYVGALGGGGALSTYQIPGTREWLLFGTVPASVTKVRLAVPGQRVTVATITHRGLPGRFFVFHRSGFGPGRSSDQQAKITAMFEANGHELRIYSS